MAEKSKETYRLKKGDRVYMLFEHAETGEERRLYGTVDSDEIPYSGAFGIRQKWDTRVDVMIKTISRCELKRFWATLADIFGL